MISSFWHERRWRLPGLLLLVPILLAACTLGMEQAATGPEGAGLANPASVNCIEQGGTLEIRERGDGGEYGVCLFDDNRQCEEWAMLRGDCPVGGIRVTGYLTEAAIYCAITGSEYTVTGTGDSGQEQGTCTLVSGEVCEATAYFDGDCPVSE